MPSRSPPALSDCTVEVEVREQYRGYRFRPDDPRVRIAADALARRGRPAHNGALRRRCRRERVQRRGLPCAILANGMAEIHTPDEHIAVADLERMVDVTLAHRRRGATGAAALSLRWGT